MPMAEHINLSLRGGEEVVPWWLCLILRQAPPPPPLPIPSKLAILGSAGVMNAKLQTLTELSNLIHEHLCQVR